MELRTVERKLTGKEALESLKGEEEGQDVTPDPGFVIKTKRLDDNVKVLRAAAMGRGAAMLTPRKSRYSSTSRRLRWCRRCRRRKSCRTTARSRKG